MKKILFLLALICLAVPGYTQIQWQKCLGGSNSDEAEDIRQTSDGGYIVAGYSLSSDGDVTMNHGNYDAWIVKLSSSGSIEWQRCLGGSSGDFAYSIEQTSDGGYITAGYTSSNDGDVSGNHIGSDTRDAWVVKLSSTGVIEWQKCLGGGDQDEAYSVKQTIGGGYIVAGNTSSTDGDVTGAHGGSDAWVIKLTNTGSIEWQKTLGGNSNEFGRCIAKTYDEGYILTGSSYSTDGDVTAHHGTDGNSDVWVVKLSATGNIEWEKSLGGSSDDNGYSIQQTFDTGYIITGNTYSTNGDVTGHIGGTFGREDLWLVKLTKEGAVQWNRCDDDDGSEKGTSIQLTSDTGYVLCGTACRYMGACKLIVSKGFTNGDGKWARMLGGDLGEESGNSASSTNDGGYIICGTTTYMDNASPPNHGNGILDYWIIKMGNNVTAIADIDRKTDISVLPNPATNELTVTSGETITSLAIINMIGQCVYTDMYNTKKVKLNIESLAAGTYIVRVNNVYMRRFIKQ